MAEQVSKLGGIVFHNPTRQRGTSQDRFFLADASGCEATSRLTGRVVRKTRLQKTRLQKTRLQKNRAWIGLVASMFLCMATGCSIEKVETVESKADGESSAEVASVKRADSDNLKVAYVTNCVASFWVIAEKGCQDAARDLGVECLVRMPEKLDAAVQNRVLEELIALELDGLAISPVSPNNQTQLLNTVADQTNLITQDSDAPDSKRLAYIGMSNYDAGRMCGQLVKEALPEGGEVILFVGVLGQLNADQRRQGVIDELLDRDRDPNRAFDPNTGPIKGDKYTIVDTRTDESDQARAKSNAEDAIVKYPKLGCMVGLFAYNPPAMLEAVRGATKTEEIQIVGFDEQDATLQAILDGDCYGTVVQNPYQYGYKSVEILTKLARGDESALPDGGFLDIPARSIREDNVQSFWDELKELTAETP
ncbi:MAG: sugar-binding protein [Planctomycetota bacterium]